MLAGVSLEAAAGECVHVLGPNGSGKTTLLRVIAGLLLPEAGQVACNGRDTRADRDAWCAAFSYLAHSDGLKPELTAGENLAFEVGLRRDVSQSEIEGALADLGVAHARNQLVATLSAGQRRRVAFARIMLAGAPLWILDEPYTNLDRDGSVFVSAIIGRAPGCRRGGAHRSAPATRDPGSPSTQPRARRMSRTTTLSAALLVYRRDLLLAQRHWGQVAQPLVFFVMVATLFPLALSPELSELRRDRQRSAVGRSAARVAARARAAVSF